MFRGLFLLNWNLVGLLDILDLCWCLWLLLVGLFHLLWFCLVFLVLGWDISIINYFFFIYVILNILGGSFLLGFLFRFCFYCRNNRLRHTFLTFLFALWLLLNFLFDLFFWSLNLSLDFCLVFTFSLLLFLWLYIHGLSNFSRLFLLALLFFWWLMCLLYFIFLLYLLCFLFWFILCCNHFLNPFLFLHFYHFLLFLHL